MHKSFAPQRSSAEGQQRLGRRRWQVGLLLAACLALGLALSGGSVRAEPTAISMTVSNPYCVQSQLTTGACIINFRSIYASSTDSSLSHVAIVIDGKVRANHSTFFEQAIYLNQRMLGEGLQVTCGLPGASGNAAFGKVYSVQITAYPTVGSPITDVANVTCPSFVSQSYLPALNK